MATGLDDVRIATALRGLYATVGLWAKRSDFLVPHDGRAVHVNAGSRRIERVAVRERSMIVRRRTGPEMPAEARAYPRGRLPLVGTRRAGRRVDRAGCSAYQPECLTGLPAKSAHSAPRLLPDGPKILLGRLRLLGRLNFGHFAEMPPAAARCSFSPLRSEGGATS